MLPPYGPLVEHFLIDRGRVFLNHGSFGATPRAALTLQEQLRARVEADPVEWFAEAVEPLLDEARAKIAAFVDADEAGLMLIANATAGVSNVVRNLDLRPGDELLTSSHEYNACSNALRAAADAHVARGVNVTVATTVLPCPVSGDDEVVAAIVGGITRQTRLLLLSHITSPSGLILPALRIVREAVARAKALGNERFEVLVDGAHAPGYIELSVRSFLEAGAAYYTGNLHKWACGPKGTAFLAVRAEKAGEFTPLIVSHGYNSLRADRSRFRQMADYVGSIDYTPWLAVPACVDLVGSFSPTGWPGVRAMQAELRREAVRILSERLKPLGGGAGETLGPEHMLGAMAAVTLPAHKVPVAFDPRKPFDPVYYALREKWKVQIPAYSLLTGDGTRRRVVRFSAGVYNAPGQFAYLADALVAELS